MSRRWLVGVYEKEESLLAAIGSLRQGGWLIHDAYTPYPVPGMDKALGLKHSRLGWVTFIGAMSGALGMGLTEIYVAVIAWPVNIGGKPAASLPAFFPPVFEAGVLAGALGTVGALLWVSQLFPGQEVEIEIPDVNDHRFAVALDADQAPQAAEKIRALLEKTGASEILEKSAKPEVAQ
jgi:hypothetical protein